MGLDVGPPGDTWTSTNRHDFPGQKEHNSPMATREIQPPGLPENLMAEIARIARDQNRSVSEVLADAVDRYVKEQQWDALKRYGRAQAAERGLTEGDVHALIADYRKEPGR